MKAPQCVVALLSLSLLPAQSFRSVPLPRRIGAPSRASLLKSTPRASNNDVEPNTDPILLPPADYSKPGRVVNLVSGAFLLVSHVYGPPACTLRVQGF